jgi:hypothetical protein
MGGISLRDGFSVARSQARDRIENAIDLKQLFRVIDADPAIVGAGVVYIDSDFNVVTLREFQPICSVAVKRVVLREAPRYMGAQAFVRALESNPRESQIVKESISAVVACTGAVLSWIVVISGSVLIPFTAGSSAVFTPLGWASALAGTAQCAVGLGRVVYESVDPAVIDILDSNEWYETTMNVLDLITLAGASVSIVGTRVLKKVMLNTTGKSIRQGVKGLSRQERYQLTTELLSMRHPELTLKMIKLERIAKRLPKRFAPIEVKSSLQVQIKDLWAGRLAVVGSIISGNLKPVAVGIYEEVFNP